MSALPSVTMVALDAVARLEEDRLRTSSYRRSPRGTTLCPVLALSRSLYRPLTPPQKTTPQQRLQEAARGDEAFVRKVHRRPYLVFAYFVFAVALRRVAFGARLTTLVAASC